MNDPNSYEVALQNGPRDGERVTVHANTMENKESIASVDRPYGQKRPYKHHEVAEEDEPQYIPLPTVLHILNRGDSHA